MLKKISKLFAFWGKKKDSPKVVVGIYDDYDQIPADILEKAKQVKVPIVSILSYMGKYPFTFFNFGEKFGDPTGWDNIFYINKHFDFTPSLKMFFAEYELIISIKKTLQYDKRFEAIRVASYQLMVTRKGEVVYRGQGNPLEVMPNALEFLLSATNEILSARNAQLKHSIYVTDFKCNMSTKDCDECKKIMAMSKAKRPEICPECLTPTKDIII